MFIYFLRKTPRPGLSKILADIEEDPTSDLPRSSQVLFQKLKIESDTFLLNNFKKLKIFQVYPPSPKKRTQKKLSSFANPPTTQKVDDEKPESGEVNRNKAKPRNGFVNLNRSVFSRRLTIIHFTYVLT